MSLIELIRGTRKSTPGGSATAIPAIPATDGAQKAVSVARVATVAVANPTNPKTVEPVTSWGWRIVDQDGAEVEAYFSPVVTRDEALRLSPGAVEAKPIPSFCATTRTEIPADLKRLINAMGKYWNFSSDDYETAFQGARSDPSAWRAMCLEDQRRFGWQVPKVPSPGDLEQVAEERRAILEYEAKLKAEQADVITRLAADFYLHLFGVAYETRCCKPRSGSYCAEGLRLRDAYYGAVS